MAEKTKKQAKISKVMSESEFLKLIKTAIEVEIVDGHYVKIYFPRCKMIEIWTTHENGRLHIDFKE